MSEKGAALVAGLIGEGIAASRTPAMHEAEGAAQGIEYSYRSFDTAKMTSVNLGSLISDLRAEGLVGVNVTHPFKQKVLAHVTECAPEVARVGASNTVLFAERGPRAHNTDYLGFLHAFRSELGTAPRNRVLLLGAGGAGRAVGLALAEAGVGTLFIRDSNADAAEQLAADIRENFPQTVAEPVDAAGTVGLAPDGIVNATPVGMASHPGMPLERSQLEHRPWVADIVYFPLETELLRTARELGCVTMSGRGMAVMQAAKAFEIFTNKRADVDRMAQTFDSFDAKGDRR